VTPLLLALPSDRAAAAAIAEAAGAELGEVEVRPFPDGELYVRLGQPVRGREVWVVATMHPVGERLLAALLVGGAARDAGAARVGLCAPYLGYLRQDAEFGAGEAVTSRLVARHLALAFDRLITIDPHLHRYASLDEVLPFPSRVVAAAPAIVGHLRPRGGRPIVVGPDAESRQWAAPIADALGAPLVVLEKTRRGDRDVAVSAAPADLPWAEATPIVVDDVISTGRTMIETLGALARVGARPALCVGIHAVFAGDALADLRAAGAAAIETCDTIRHPSNAIGVLGDLGRALARPW
jgi:ribose-phosphate pyrophosphokinase